MPRARTAAAVLVCCVAPVLLAGYPAGSLPTDKLPHPPARKPVSGAERVDLNWGVKIPMRDGTHLSATVYRPRDVRSAVPVLCTITPYVSDNYHDRAVYFAAHGYVFVIVDSRGRGNSEGSFEPFAGEGRDGYDVVEWLAGQPWCNGKVGMWGGSYAGTNQWATLKECPPHLATIVPVASAHPGVDFPAQGGIFHLYFIRWLTLTAGTTLNQKLFSEDAFWIGKFGERYRQHLPLQELDVLVGGKPCDHYRKWLKHRPPDAYWESMVPSAEDYAKIHVPILTITGHFDDDQPGALEFYRRHARHGSKKGFERHYLIMGPWDHSGTRTPVANLGGLTFGPASVVDLNRMHKEWYDWTLKGLARPPVLKSRVLYYHAGAEHWKYADSLDGVGAGPRKFYLGSGGQAGDVFHSGTLSADTPGESPTDRYAYDPLDLRRGDLETSKIDSFLTDQRFALNLFGNGVVYHSEPLERTIDLTGQMRFVAWVALDVPDTDLQVAVYEVLHDGTSIALGEDRIRARFRESLKQEKLIKAGEVNCYEFKNFAWTSRRLGKGSRLRVVVQCPNSIYLEKNYNSGAPLGLETKKDARTAHVTLYHDAEHPSCLELPEVPEPEDEPAPRRKE